MADQQLNFSALRTRSTTLRTHRTDWLQAWMDGEALDAAVLEQHGFQPALHYAVVIFRSPNETISGAQFAQQVHSEASRRGINGPVAPHESAAVLFHPVEDPQQTTRLKRKTEEIRVQLSARYGAEICCGAGRPLRGMEALRQSFQEAERALTLCNELQANGRATFFGNTSLYGLLMTTTNRPELYRFCSTWLSDLITYDREQNSDLLETLKTYFSNNGNTALTAKELRIHRNTLAYRLNRIAEITSLDLDDADVRLNLHLALKAHEVLGLASAGVVTGVV